MPSPAGPPPLLIGSSDFRSLREAGACYVDKTDFVGRVLASPSMVLLLPRPRRFGKTTNLWTLRHFVEKRAEDVRHLFRGLAVERDAAAQGHFQRYPVIFLTFKDAKEPSFGECLEALAAVIGTEYGRHRALLEGDLLGADERRRYERVLERTASKVELERSLGDLSDYLMRAHREKVVILIDEYDTPIHAGYARGYYDEVVGFFRNFLSTGLKDNPALFKGVLTGILRVAKESIFSGLNNLTVYSLMRSEFAADFGFTEAEVARLLETLGAEGNLAELRAWYNGYLFGGEVVYNPWSVMSFLASEDKRFRPYWAATSSNELLERLLLQQGMGLRGELETLLDGGSIEKPIKENIVLRELDKMPDAIWSFLLFSGYLKPLSWRTEDDVLLGRLAVPNREVLADFEELLRGYLAVQTGGEVELLLKALVGGDERSFEHYLGRFLLTSLSYHDPAARTPERVYHAFLLGLLVSLRPRWEVTSNRESGFGRCDLLIAPRSAGEPGVVLELKTVDRERGETPEQALDAALAQLRDRRYASALADRGARPIHQMAAAFDGKRVWVRRADEAASS